MLIFPKNCGIRLPPSPERNFSAEKGLLKIRKEVFMIQMCYKCDISVQNPAYARLQMKFFGNSGVFYAASRGVDFQNSFDSCPIRSGPCDRPFKRTQINRLRRAPSGESESAVLHLISTTCCSEVRTMGLCLTFLQEKQLLYRRLFPNM